MDDNQRVVDLYEKFMHNREMGQVEDKSIQYQHIGIQNFDLPEKIICFLDVSSFELHDETE